MQRTDKYSQHSSCWFESRCCHLNFRYGACFEDIQASIEYRFTLKLVGGMIITYSENYNCFVKKK